MSQHSNVLFATPGSSEDELPGAEDMFSAEQMDSLSTNEWELSSTSDTDEGDHRTKTRKKKKVSFSMEKSAAMTANERKIDGLVVPEVRTRRRPPPVTQAGVEILPTYRKASVNPFNADMVRKVIHSVFDHYLHKDQPWPADNTLVGLKALQLGGAVRDAVEKLRFERYKVVCLVDLIEKPRAPDGAYDTPSYISGYNVVFDVDKDAVVSAAWENQFFVCSCVVFGCYAE